MINKKIGVLLLLMVLFSFGAQAQLTTSVKINEVLVVNEDNFVDDYGKRHFDSNGHLMGDYESAYERRLPDPVKDLKVTRWDWEACMTVPENQWGYHKDWSLSYVKTRNGRVVHF